MICQKCETENQPENKYCRKCGVVLTKTFNEFENTDDSPVPFIGDGYAQLKQAAGIFSLIGSIFTFAGIFAGKFVEGFPTMIFFVLGVGFLFFALIKNLKAMEVQKNRSVKAVYENQQVLSSTKINELLPSSSQDYISEVSPYQTNELVHPPPSVTENTTRHLEMDSEGETMTLPKKN